MVWPFGRRKAKRYERVNALDEQARAGSTALLQKIEQLDSSRKVLVQLNRMDQLSEDALKELRGHNV